MVKPYYQDLRAGGVMEQKQIDMINDKLDAIARVMRLLLIERLNEHYEMHEKYDSMKQKSYCDCVETEIVNITEVLEDR